MQLSFDLVPAPKKEKLVGRNEEVYIAKQINNDTTQNQVQRNWFSLYDIFYRLTVSAFGFAYALIVYPLTLTYYSFIYNKTHYGITWGVISFLFLPFWPLILFIKNLCSFILQRKTAFLSLEQCEDGEMDELDSMVFFTDNLPLLQSFLHDYLQMVMSYLANFYILGPSLIGIQTMYWDTDRTNKLFWRKLLRDAGGRIPKQLGLWQNNDHEFRKDICNFREILIKVADSCLGIGDKFLDKGRDFQNAEDIVNILKSSYKDKTCILMEVVKPLPQLGVHSLDILTAKDPQGRVQLVDIIVWSGTKTRTSHAATQGYMIDHKTGKTKSTCKWYNPNFSGTSDNGIGVLYPNLADAISVVMEAHKDIRFSWLPVIGWDAMITEDNDVVFFEGNLGAWRCPRRLFLSLRNFIYFVSHLSWISKQ